MSNLEQLKNQLHIYALLAVSKIEAEAREFLLETGNKLLGEEKRLEAINVVVLKYQGLTEKLPFLKDTEIDDTWIREQATKYVDEACGFMLLKLNELGKAPIVDAPELSGGHVDTSGEFGGSVEPEEKA